MIYDNIKTLKKIRRFFFFFLEWRKLSRNTLFFFTWVVFEKSYFLNYEKVLNCDCGHCGHCDARCGYCKVKHFWICNLKIRLLRLDAVHCSFDVVVATLMQLLFQSIDVNWGHIAIAVWCNCNSEYNYNIAIESHDVVLEIIR